METIMLNYFQCLVYRSGNLPEEISLESVSEHLKDPEVFLWIELKEPDAMLLSKLGEELGLHELAVEDALTTHQRPKLEEYGDHLFISARTVHVWDHHIELGETHLFAGNRFVAAIRHGHAPSFAKICDQLTARRKNHKRGASFALYCVLDLITDHYQPVVEIVHDRFRNLENVLLSNRLERVELEKLYTLKRELNTLRDTVEPMQSIVQDLIRLHPEFVPKELRAYYRDVHDHTIRITRSIDMLRVSASDAMQFHLAALTLKQNESVQKLAAGAPYWLCPRSSFPFMA